MKRLCITACFIRLTQQQTCFINHERTAFFFEGLRFDSCVKSVISDKTGFERNVDLGKTKIAI